MKINTSISESSVPQPRVFSPVLREWGKSKGSGKHGLVSKVKLALAMVQGEETEAQLAARNEACQEHARPCGLKNPVSPPWAGLG